MTPELAEAQDTVHASVTHLLTRDRRAVGDLLGPLNEDQTLRCALVACDLAAWLVHEWAENEGLSPRELWAEMALRVSAWREGVAP